MNAPERKPVDEALIEAMEYIAYLCKDVPDKPRMFPEEPNMSDLITIKDVAKKALIYVERAKS